METSASEADKTTATARKKRAKSSKLSVTNHDEAVPPKTKTPKKRQSRKKATTVSVIETVNESSQEDVVKPNQEPVESEVVSPPKKSARRVGQRKQGRDQVGLEEG